MESKDKVKKGLFLSVVVPAYNEEKKILNTLKVIDSYLSSQDYSYEIIIANDGSSDSTFSIASTYASTSQNIRVLDLPHRGKANTVIDGIKSSKGKYILFTDADNATPISEVKKLLHYVSSEDYDLAIGSREGVGAVRKNEPFIRHMMGRIFNSIIQFLLVDGIEDTQCGFKLFKNKVAQQIISRMKLYDGTKIIDVPKVTAFDVEMLFIAKKLGYKIKPVPVEWTYGDDSKVSHLRDSINNFLEVVKVYINNKKGFYD